MTKWLTILILTTLFSSSLNGQGDTLNKSDINGKKNGFWIAYLDAHLNPTDSPTSYFKAFEYYDHGYRVFGFKKRKWHSQDSITYNMDFPKKGKPILIAGLFEWYSRGSKNPYCTEEYLNGHPIIYKSFYIGPEKGKSCLFEFVDFTRRYNNIPGTNYAEIHNQYDSEFKKFWYYKAKRHWRGHRIKD